MLFKIATLTNIITESGIKKESTTKKPFRYVKFVKALLVGTTIANITKRKIAILGWKAQNTPVIKKTINSI